MDDLAYPALVKSIEGKSELKITTVQASAFQIVPSLQRDWEAGLLIDSPHGLNSCCAGDDDDQPRSASGHHPRFRGTWFDLIIGEDVSVRSPKRSTMLAVTMSWR